MQTEPTPAIHTPDHHPPASDHEADLLPTVERCLNCTSPVHGNYCCNCGQDATDRNVSFWLLAREIFYDFLNVDSRFRQSFRPLLTKPGLLTEAYIAGRRVRYIFPPRLYLMVSIVFFFTVVNFDPLMPEDFSGMTAAELSERLAELKMSRELFDARYMQEVEDNLPIWMFAVIPMFALFMKLLYIRRKRLLVEHLVFSFHFFSFVFIALLPAMLLHIDPFTYLVFGGIMVYLIAAQKRVFGQGWGRTLAKGIILYSFFLLAILFYVYFVGAFSANTVLQR